MLRHGHEYTKAFNEIQEHNKAELPNRSQVDPVVALHSTVGFHF
jgi:hypothetical protein